jgi:hypothetical protein
MESLARLTRSLVLGDLLAELIRLHGGFELVEHWTQGEFHHDVVLRLPPGALAGPSSGASGAPGSWGSSRSVLVVATNCNGGVKELLAFDDVPSRRALWDYRVGTSSADAIQLRGSARTLHWFDPRELLGDNARSEIKREYRQRQEGGGWQLRPEVLPGGARVAGDRSRRGQT